MSGYICIGVPYFIGERIPGRSEVAMIRASGIAHEIGAQWVDVTPDFAAGRDPIVAVNRALARAILDFPAQTPIVFSGDCVNCMGTLKGLERHSPRVLWYDAHGDFNTPETTPSGFLGGMPLAWLVGRGDPRYLQEVGLTPIAEDRVTISDARDLDPGEDVALRDSAITHLPDLGGLLRLQWDAAPLYIHFDVDVISTGDMPAVSYPAPGGPSLEQAAATLRHVAAGGRVVGLLFSLFHGGMEGADRSLAGTLDLVRAFVNSA